VACSRISCHVEISCNSCEFGYIILVFAHFTVVSLEGVISCFISGSNSAFDQRLTCRALRWLWEQLDGTNVLLGQNWWSQEPNGKRPLVGLVSIPAKSVSMTNVEIYRNVKLLSSFWLLISKCLYGVLQQWLPKCSYMDIWWWNLMYAETPLLKTIWGKLIHRFQCPSKPLLITMTTSKNELMKFCSEIFFKCTLASLQLSYLLFLHNKASNSYVIVELIYKSHQNQSKNS
jgi:hypothetical protein